LEQRFIDGEELVGVEDEKCAQRRKLIVAGGVRVQTDRPKTVGFVDRPPKLLRNPGKITADEGTAGETV